MTATIWAAALRTVENLTPPMGLTPILPHHLVVVAVRYHDGSLRYDELMVGSLARRGRRIGLQVREMWVDHPGSQQGGRLIWGLPKRLGNFDWHADRVQLTDDRGRRISLAVEPKTCSVIPVLLPVPFFGGLGGLLLHTTGTVRGWSCLATLRVISWPEHWPALHQHVSTLAVIVNHAAVTIPGARRIRDR